MWELPRAAWNVWVSFEACLEHVKAGTKKTKARMWLHMRTNQNLTLASVPGMSQAHSPTKGVREGIKEAEQICHMCGHPRVPSCAMACVCMIKSVHSSSMVCQQLCQVHGNQGAANSCRWLVEVCQQLSPSTWQPRGAAKAHRVQQCQRTPACSALCNFVPVTWVFTVFHCSRFYHRMAGRGAQPPPS